MLQAIIKKIKAAPKDPGVYIFLKGKQPLYIGKASNLKNRLQNYLPRGDFSAEGGPASGWKTEALHREADSLKIIKLGSNIEALITESQLIKNLKPTYNVLWRDDKNYFYVAITKDKFPRIFLSHQLQKVESEKRTANSKSLLAYRLSLSPPQYIGPFTEGRAIKVVLRLLRKFFPYCTHNPHFRICLDAQINNCPGYCCQKNNQQLTTDNQQLIKKYKKNIAKIKSVLTGKNKRFIYQLKDPYELLVLEKIWAHEPYLQTSEKRTVVSEKYRNSLFAFPFLLSAKTAECYDNSHLSGKEAVGAMTAWRLRRPQTDADVTQNNAERIKFRESQRPVREWLPEKPLWRKFKIRGNYTEDDPRMIEEIVSRRLNHPKWPYPDLIIIDGGITQLNAAKRALKKSNVKGQMLNVIKVISFAKPEQQVYGLSNYPMPLSKLPQEFQKLIRTAIQNTHNFAIRYHRQVRRRNMI